MRFHSSIALAILASLSMARLVSADDAAAGSAPKCEKGKILLSEDFPGSALDKAWATPKGTWQVEDGVLKGVEKAEDNHPAVVRHELKTHDLIGEFAFRFDGGKMLGFSLNNQKGHVCRVTITPALITLQKDKPSKDSADKPAMLAKEKVELRPGEWHTMLVIVCGKEMAVTLDGKQLASGSNDGVDVDKTSLAFPTTGDGTSIKQVRVWEAVMPGTAK
jgi:hypothetical protein